MSLRAISYSSGSRRETHRFWWKQRASITLISTSTFWLLIFSVWHGKDICACRFPQILWLSLGPRLKGLERQPFVNYPSELWKNPPEGSWHLQRKSQETTFTLAFSWTLFHYLLTFFITNICLNLPYSFLYISLYILLHFLKIVQWK